MTWIARTLIAVLALGLALAIGGTIYVQQVPSCGRFFGETATNCD